MKSKNMSHIFVDAGLKPTDILRRYLDTAKLLDFFVNKRLYFSRGDQFQDKFEGTFTQSTKSALNTLVQSGSLDIPYDELKKRLRERVFINCWHKDLNDSMAMWQLYGQNNFSAAITTTVEKLNHALEEHCNDYLLSIRKVEYVKHWRDPKLVIRPYSNIFAYKVKAYEYEKEVRVIIDNFDSPDGEAIGRGIPLSVDANALLRTVVIAPEAPEWYVDLIQKIAKQNFIDAPVRRSMLAIEPI
jgi:hypothetical protein